MWTKLFALAITIPMTITIASAQAAQDADIAAYSQDLSMRIARGRQSGQLSEANYNAVQGLYNNVETLRRGVGNKAMNPMVRMNMMNSLTNLDKQLTGYLHDDVNARYQMWDPGKRAWRNNWWQADKSGANNFNGEIDAYQNSLQQRINSGRQSGQISRSELSQLNTAYDNINKMQQQYRIGGFSSWERNSLMSMLTQLDKDITAQMHDDDNSHYRNWNPNNKGWNNSWWKNGAGNVNQGRDGRPGDRNDRNDRNDRGHRGDAGRPGGWNNNDSHRADWNRGDSSGADSRKDWSQGDGIRSNSNTKDWNGGRSNRGDSNNRSGFGQSNESVNRSSNPSGGTATGANLPWLAPPSTTPPSAPTSPPIVSPSAGTTKTYTPPIIPSGSGAGSSTTSSTTSGTPPANTAGTPNTPPSGSGTSNTGSSDERRGNWSRDGRGEGRGDRTGTWERKPQN